MLLVLVYTDFITFITSKSSDPFSIDNMKSLKSARVAKPTRGLQLRGDGTVIFTIM
jgi:hypothetical protein